jgi:pimeloyl-ACP methyl ester carboxylesterase
MPSSVRQRKAPAAAAWADRWWTSGDGLKLHARDYAACSGGARLPVLCIHGLTRNSRDFEDLAPKLASWGRRVLAVDVRGRGLSARDPNPLNYHPATYVSDIATLLDQLGVRQVQVVGTSMGGLIAMVMAAMRPDLLAGVVLNDVGPVIAPTGLARIGGYLGKPSGVRSWRGASAYVRAHNIHAFPAYTAADWTRMARRLFRSEDGSAPELDYDFSIAAPIRAAVALGGPPPDLWPYFEAMAADGPLTIIRGATSDVLDLATLARMQQIAPHAVVAEVQDVGHAPMLDEPAALAAIHAHMEKAA